MSKCIFISPAFFGYEQKISAQLKTEFDEVVFLDERIGNSTFKKVLSRMALKTSNVPLVGTLLGKVKGHYANRLYQEYASLIEGVDFLLCIVPETMPEWFLLEIKKKNPNVKSVLYMWDSFANRPYIKAVTHHYDKIYTFDDHDAQAYGYELLPLFYSDDYRPQVERAITPKYDFCFIGTAHSDRYFIAKQLQAMVQHESFVYLYLQSKLQFYMQKLTNKSFRNAKIDAVQFVPIEPKKVATIIEESKAVLDIQQNKQNGLTMRTIEVALGMRKKMITTNPNIVKYDFFNEKNILVVDRNEIGNIDLAFFEQEYEPLDETLYQKYSLAQWVKNIIN